MQEGGTHFTSETDTEVLAHLIGKIYDESQPARRSARHKARLVEALTRRALKQVIGTYGIALVHADIPDFIDRRAPRQPARARRR